MEMGWVEGFRSMSSLMVLKLQQDHIIKYLRFRSMSSLMVLKLKK